MYIKADCSDVFLLPDIDWQCYTYDQECQDGERMLIYISSIMIIQGDGQLVISMVHIDNSPRARVSYRVWSFAFFDAVERGLTTRK